MREVLGYLAIAAVCFLVVILLMSTQSAKCREAGGHPETGINIRGVACIKNDRIINP